LRAGLAGGPVLLFEGDDYIGAAVNLRHVCATWRNHARSWPRPIWCRRCWSIPRPLPIGSRHVSGFAQPIEVVRLISAEARLRLTDCGFRSTR
jgi:class 3 adenylate cyclase